MCNVDQTGLDQGFSLDSKSVEKELKAATPKKSEACVTAFTKKLVKTYQWLRTWSGHISPEEVKLVKM